ncbi:hypothetical protein BH019_19275 [Salmonella enterica]|nr:hypothetical protein [Salmonella enterica]
MIINVNKYAYNLRNAPGQTIKWCEPEFQQTVGRNRVGFYMPQIKTSHFSAAILQDNFELITLTFNIG